MSEQNDKIKLVNFIVRLGNNPRFEVHADERSSINPGDARYHRKGAGEELLDLFRDVLTKLGDRYPNGGAIGLCIDESQKNREIRSPSEC